MVRAEPSGAVIIRQTKLQLCVGCEMQRDTVVRVVYLSREEETANVTSSGRYNISMAFYHSSSFLSTVEEFPYIVDLNQDLFIEAQLYSSDSNLVLFVDTCVASPSDFDFHSQTYTLIKNGCVRDGTYGTYNAPLGRARLHFSSFRFLRTYPSVYLQCKIVVCQAYDYSSRCYQGCQPRKRRDLSSSHEKVNVVLGPIQLRDQATGELLSKQEAPLVRALQDRSR
ncbi:CUB and zona pellucida-like domain-containing protein 1 [Lepisosteus oculatus]|uniref:CUB and zona pellucida-like domain-containing protein 1 n=1 Tax=Lepisosteus oculatus TaxID=7918 RepID=UPI00371E7CDC